MSTADKLLSVLDLFGLDRPDWSIDEAASALGLATSTTYRYFASLTAAGLLAPFVPTRYVLGPTIIRYDRQLRLTDPLISAAQSEMRLLAGMRPGQSVVFLCRLLGGMVMCVDQAFAGSPPFAVAYERGRLMPLFAGSASKVILAHLPPRQLRALYTRPAAAFAGVGLGADWGGVRLALKAIRQRGYLSVAGELDPGMHGLSVPIREIRTNILASLSIVGPLDVLLETDVPSLAKRLREAAGRIEKELADKSAAHDAADRGQTARG